MSEVDKWITEAKAAKKKRDEGAAELSKLKTLLMAAKDAGKLSPGQSQAVGLAYSTRKRKPKGSGQAAKNS
jgi:ABC-type Mn2+/Zn2+ transport system ATPase subunit